MAGNKMKESKEAILNFIRNTQQHRMGLCVFGETTDVIGKQNSFLFLFDTNCL